MLEVEKLSANYGNLKVLKEITFSLKKGDKIGILGVNGAGKTTTVEILEGYRKASSGDVSVLGFDPATKGNAAQRWRNQIGIVLQSTSDAADLSVVETISHYANYYENPRNVEQVIDEVGLREKLNAKARELSGGQRRRLGAECRRRQRHRDLRRFRTRRCDFRLGPEPRHQPPAHARTAARSG